MELNEIPHENEVAPLLGSSSPESEKGASNGNSETFDQKLIAILLGVFSAFCYALCLTMVYYLNKDVMVDAVVYSALVGHLSLLIIIVIYMGVRGYDLKVKRAQIPWLIFHTILKVGHIFLIFFAVIEIRLITVVSIETMATLILATFIAACTKIEKVGCANIVSMFIAVTGCTLLIQPWNMESGNACWFYNPVFTESITVNSSITDSEDMATSFRMCTTGVICSIASGFLLASSLVTQKAKLQEVPAAILLLWFSVLGTLVSVGIIIFKLGLFKREFMPDFPHNAVLYCVLVLTFTVTHVNIYVQQQSSVINLVTSQSTVATFAYILSLSVLRVGHFNVINTIGSSLVLKGTFSLIAGTFLAHYKEDLQRLMHFFVKLIHVGPPRQEGR